MSEPSIRLDPRLIGICEKVSRLITELPRLRDWLDLVAGGLASLIRANQLGYKDRLGSLPPGYYGRLSKRVKKMAEGALPAHGPWISGYYFNSGLLRIAAALEQLSKVSASVNKRTPGCLRSMPTHGINLEWNRLKHQLSGVAAGRRVTFKQALATLEEMVVLVDDHKAVFQDPSVRVPKMEVSPRRKARPST